MPMMRLRAQSVMVKYIFVIALTVISPGSQAQKDTAPLSLEVAQQRARFAREQMAEAQRDLQTAQKMDAAAQKRLEEVRLQSEQSAKRLLDAQAQFDKARHAHDAAYQELKRAHEAFKESSKKP